MSPNPAVPPASTDRLEPCQSATACDKPRSTDALHRLGLQAIADRDWPRAIALWRMVKTRDDRDHDAAAFLVLALREDGRLDEAEAQGAAAIAATPDLPRAYLEHAMICFVTRDWPEAKRRIDRFRLLFPHILDGYTRGSAIAREFNDGAEAIAMLRRGLRNFPADAELWLHCAEVAEIYADWPQVARCRLALHRLLPPRRPADWLPPIEALIHAGRPEDARTLCDEALAIFPADKPLHSLAAGLPPADRSPPAFAPLRADTAPHGRLADALAHGAWTYRGERAELIVQDLQLLPDGSIRNHPGGEEWSWRFDDGCVCFVDVFGVTIVRFNETVVLDSGAFLLRGARRQLPEPRIFTLEQAGPAMAEIMARFESLGDNCEFGMAQRHFTIDPLGLLRFGHCDLAALRQAIADRFAAMTQDASSLRISIHPEQREYMGHVPAYRFVYHTWVPEHSSTPEAMRAREFPRLRYLARKLFEDLARAEKIFVRKGTIEEAPEDALALSRQLRSLGPNWLLWVREADASHPDGHVEIIEDGLLHGTLASFAPYPQAARIHADSWARLCLNTLRLLRRL